MNYFWLNGIEGAGAALGIPGFDGDVKYNNPGIPNMNVSGFATLGEGGTNWFQYDKTFQLSDVISYTRGNHNLRAGFDRAGGDQWRAPGTRPAAVSRSTAT